MSTTIALRMGRPEKAMPRKMKPPVHILFPIGKNGGPKRDILKASQQTNINVDLINRFCNKCKTPSFSIQCHKCGNDTKLILTCPKCHRHIDKLECPICKIKCQPYGKFLFPIKKALDEAIYRVKYKPKILKGVQSLTNALRIPEPIEKGIIRQKYGLSVYKDGTVRFDATNAPLTHFTPNQIGISIKLLKNLGYDKDINNNKLKFNDQIIEIFDQDIILPNEAGDYLLKVTQYIDDLLTNLYCMEPYYKINSKKDLIGHLVIGLAPHTSVGIIGRIIGFSSTQVCFAHPYWHSAKRRDCDGDEDAIILLLDVLLNFSKEYLPAQIGGLMDAPLLYQPIILPEEVQRQVHNLDVSELYPIKFYEATQRFELPHLISDSMDIIRNRLRHEKQFSEFHFTHKNSSITCNRQKSMYSTLNSLQEKLNKQIELAIKIKSVDVNDVVSSVLKSHILPDIIGNIRAYTSQSFQCKSCGQKNRRYPILGCCPYCGKVLQATVSRASVEKYLNLGLILCNKFNVNQYIKDRFEIISEELSLLFPSKNIGKQLELTDFN
jgi:DNA polymerase II large subunit